MHPINTGEIAPRLATGAFILNSGIGKRAVDGETAAHPQGMAAGTYPVLNRPGSITPTPDGLALAKDVWMLGIGVGLVAEALTRRSARRC